MSDLFINYNDESMDFQLVKYKKLRNKSLPYSTLALALNFIISFFISIYFGFRVINHSINVSDFIFLTQSYETFANNLTSLFQLIPDFKKHSLYINNINKILNFTPDIKENMEGDIVHKDKDARIEIKNVYFSYPNNPDKMILKDISLNINSGMKLAIVGYNGSGKSTLIKLLLYLYKVSEGSITYNNKLYEKYKTSSLRSAFGILFQDFQIYSFSIAENILLREIENEDDEKLVIEALEFSGLWEKVQCFQYGIHTMLTKEFDEEGIYFSGGEYQKLAIARAYASQCKILVFDELSSALDPLAEHEMFHKLLEIGNNKTIIYVSHRLSSTVDADRIILLDEGSITEAGKHNELMKKQGKYYEMFKLQSEKYQATGGE